MHMIKIKLIDSRWDPNPGDYKSMIVLNYDEWDDFGYRTSFGMFFCDANGLVQKIGEVKIYYWENEIGRKNSYNDHTRCSMEADIVSLSDAYCSLGQDLKYYKTLKTLFPREYRDILRRLNDIAIFEDIRDRFINESGVKTSLLRFSSAQKALNEATKVVVDELEEKKDISFKYHIKMPYDETPVDLDFNFKQTQDIPYRINIIIGKNGAGKTQLLSRLANSLSGYTDEKEMDCFLGGRPPIDKVMSISYSAFDSFKKPNGEKMNQRSVFSYVYCGIQSDKGTLSLDDLKHNLKIAYAMVKEKNRKEEWIEVLSELMEEEHRKTVDSIIAERFEEVNLSSGQQILICLGMYV